MRGVIQVFGSKVALPKKTKAAGLHWCVYMHIICFHCFFFGGGWCYPTDNIFMLKHFHIKYIPCWFDLTPESVRLIDKKFLGTCQRREDILFQPDAVTDRIDVVTTTGRIKEGWNKKSLLSNTTLRMTKDSYKSWEEKQDIAIYLQPLIMHNLTMNFLCYKISKGRCKVCLLWIERLGFMWDSTWGLEMYNKI